MAAAPPPVKPRWRGVSHQWAFFVSLALALGLILAAPGAKAAVAAAIYAVSLCGLLGVSALYHRRTWATVRARMWMRRLDHAMIFLLIAGTYTPFALLVMHGTLATVILAVVWSGALAGIVTILLWPTAPKWVNALIAVSLGWVAVAAAPQLVANAGLAATLLLAAGGLLYTAGAIVYATHRPDPRPATFGYHEVFHVLVLAAAAVHFGAVAGFALPAGA
ncbi:MAG: hemolysin III family protein [Solirubrobacteraceae bacterium]